MKWSKNCLGAILVSYLLITLSGCTVVKGGCRKVTEGVRGVLGVSLKELEDNRKGAIKKNFNCEQAVCYAKVKNRLVNNGAYIYAQNKGLIAIFVSQTDTTPVGIFFTKIDAGNTQVEVSSPSPYTKEVISARVFRALEDVPEPKNEKGLEDAKETINNK